MKIIKLPLLHCYRCFYSWIPTKTTVRMCPRCKSIKWDLPRVRLPPYKGGGMGIAELVAPKRDQIRKLVRQFGFSKPRIFGSVARGEAGPESDVDILVRKNGGGLLERAGLSLELERLLGRSVDVATEGSLKWYAQDEILAQAVPL